MWFKVDDKLHDHPKIQHLLDLDDGVTALGLWLLAGSWCGDQLSDGLISSRVLSRWYPEDWRCLAELLVEARLWHREGPDPSSPCDTSTTRHGPCQPELVGAAATRVHYRFHHFCDYNDPRRKILSDRRITQVRNELHKDPVLKAAIRERDEDRCRYCGSQVQWGNNRGPAGGTWDHVIPVSEGGVNTLKNVVVSCRGCNERKGARTPQEAGMKLLRPGTLGAPQPEQDAPAAATPDRPAEPTSAVSDEGFPIGSGRVGSGARSELSSDSNPPTDQDPAGPTGDPLDDLDLDHGLTNGINDEQEDAR